MGKRCDQKFLKRTFLVFCEGQTEYYYYNSFKNSEKFSFVFKPVDVHGGGYSNMLETVKRSGNQGIMVKIILLDFDRFFIHPTEQKVFDDICNYVKSQNSKGNPIVLVISNPDFDEFILLHDSKYTGNRNNYLKTIGYKSIDDLKADKKVYDKFNKGNNPCVDNALSRLNPHTPISNKISFIKSRFEFRNVLLVNHNYFNIKTSNINDLYKAISIVLG